MVERACGSFASLARRFHRPRTPRKILGIGQRRVAQLRLSNKRLGRPLDDIPIDHVTGWACRSAFFAWAELSVNKSSSTTLRPR